MVSPQAEAAANLQPPNIVSIHEVWEHEGRHYFSMDFVEGTNLSELVREGPLPAGKAATLVKTIAEAIHYAHQRGTLHRDLKPQNILIDATGQPRITDFGLAKLTKADSGVTQTGAVMGSPSYMPPEQASGRPDQVGPASDVYSIGAILYELLTGRPPFRGESPLATLQQVLNEEAIQPSKLNPNAPPDLDAICLKCLEKRPERRYSSASDLAEDLTRFLNHEPIQARSASTMRRAWSWTLRHPWIITALAVLVGLGLLGLAYGLWEQLRLVQWKSTHTGPFQGANRPHTEIEANAWVTGLFFPFAVLFYYGFLASLQFRRTPPIKRPQLKFSLNKFQLALGWIVGISALLAGLALAREEIWFYVWSPSRARGLLVFFSLFASFFPCWIGAFLLWGMARERRTALFGSTEAIERKPLPRIEWEYENPGTMLAIVALNTMVFWALGRFVSPSAILLGDLLNDPINALLGGWLGFLTLAGLIQGFMLDFKIFRVLGQKQPVLWWIILGGFYLFFVVGSPSLTFTCEATLAGLAGGLLLVRVA